MSSTKQSRRPGRHPQHQDPIEVTAADGSVIVTIGESTATLDADGVDQLVHQALEALAEAEAAS